MNKSINFLLILIVILITACTGGDKKNAAELRLKYINMKYMFTLQFPEKWINYIDFEKSEIIDPQITVPVIYFALPSRSREWQPLNVPSGYAELFYIRIFNLSQWKLYKEKYSGSAEFKLSDKISGDQKDFMYMIRFSNSIPVDLYLYMKDSDAVTSTFQIIQKD